MDIFKMATEIANNMSSEDKSSIENMDMESMISHVTKNVFKMMNGNTDISEGSFSSLGDIMGLMGNSNLTEKPSSPKTSSIYLPRTRDICFDLNVDLEDFYNGKKKKLNIKRKRIVEIDNKQKVIEEKKKLIISIERGMKDEQQLRFEGEADQIPGYTPGDVVITLIENEHPIFQRDNDNLVIIKNINLYQAYNYLFDVTHLDSRIIRITKNNSDALHLNDSIRKISGQGMPIYNEAGYGDLFIRFNLVIPKSLEPESLAKLKEIFNDTSEELSETYSKQFLLEHVTESDLEDISEDSSDSETDTDSDSDLSVSSASVEDVYLKKR